MCSNREQPWEGTRRRAVAIVLLGAGLGLGVNLVSPRGLPFVTPPEESPPPETFITLEKAKDLWYGGLSLFLDARDPADYAAGHIGNALNLPVLSFEKHFGEVAPLLTSESPLVLYCDGGECELSRRLVQNLGRLGFTNTLIFSNGWTAWRKAGLPVKRAGTQ